MPLVGTLLLRRNLIRRMTQLLMRSKLLVTLVGPEMGPIFLVLSF